MAKYHINPDTGVVGQCRAKTRCKFSARTEHYDHFEDALAAAEEQQEWVHRLLFSHEKKPKALPARAQEEHRASRVGALKTPVAKKEATLLHRVFEATDWADQASVDEYHRKLAQRASAHRASEQAAEAAGQWTKAKAHRAVAEVLQAKN